MTSIYRISQANSVQTILVLFLLILSACESASSFENGNSSSISECRAYGDSHDELNAIDDLILLHDGNGEYALAAECVRYLVELGFDMPSNLADVAVYSAKSGQCEEAHQARQIYNDSVEKPSQDSPQSHSYYDPLLKKVDEAIESCEKDRRKEKVGTPTSL